MAIRWCVCFSMLASSRRSARLGQRDRHAPAPGPPDPADAVHVALRSRRHVVVDDVGERVHVEAPGGDVGGDQQLGRAVAQPPHHPVALRLVHAPVQRLGPVATPVQRLGQLVDLGPGTAEHERRRRRLHVEDAAERGRLVGAGHDVGALGDEPAVGGRVGRAPMAIRTGSRR